MAADVAHKAVVAQDPARWQVTVTDDTGETVWQGLTRRRPTSHHKRQVAARVATCVFP